MILLIIAIITAIATPIACYIHYNYFFIRKENKAISPTPLAKSRKKTPQEIRRIIEQNKVNHFYS